jgi:hypothetical protein
MYDQFNSATAVERNPLISAGMSSFSWPIKDFSVGSTTYVFLKPIQRCDIPGMDGWISYFRALTQYSGKGQTAEEAFEDLKINIHTDFQQLHRKRPFEMSKEESARWSSLASVIDVFEYKITTPVVVREIGQVSYGMRSRPYRIKWITGENYLIEPEKVPGDLMACITSEWIEAVVKRDPVSNQVLEIESINRIRFRIPTETEIRRFWGNIPSADLPRSDWSW